MSPPNSGTPEANAVAEYQAYIARWRTEAAAWVEHTFRDEFGKPVVLEDYQREAVDAYNRGERQISMRSGHGVGKSFTLAVIIAHHAVFYFPQKTVVTAPTEGQLFDGLAAEVKTWMKQLPPAVASLFEITTDHIRLKSAPEESFISFRTSSAERPEALAGVHSANVLLVVDEASGVPEQIFEAASGSMSGESATTLLAGNPVRTSGTFFLTHTKLKQFWHTIHVSCLTSKRVSKKYVDEQRKKFGEGTNPWRVRVLGEFPITEEGKIMPYELVEAALDRDVQPLRVRSVWGLDVARKGADRCALAKRRGNVLEEKVTAWHTDDTMKLVSYVKAEWDRTVLSERPVEINVDVIGIGAGTVDRLREMGLPARGINVSETAAMSDQYRNLRAELWFLAKDWFTKRDVNLACDDELLSELTDVGFDYLPTSNKIFVESKKDIKKRGGKSPDLADALILTFASAAVVAQQGSTAAGTSWSQPLKRNLGVV